MREDTSSGLTDSEPVLDLNGVGVRRRGGLILGWESRVCGRAARLVGTIDAMLKYSRNDVTPIFEFDFERK